MSKGGRVYPSDTEFGIVMRDIRLRLQKLKRASKRPPAPTTYHSVPALVNKVITLILQLVELEKHSLRNALKTAAALHPLNPPPPPPANTPPLNISRGPPRYP